MLWCRENTGHSSGLPAIVISIIVIPLADSSFLRWWDPRSSNGLPLQPGSYSKQSKENAQLAWVYINVLYSPQRSLGTVDLATFFGCFLLAIQSWQGKKSWSYHGGAQRHGAAFSFFFAGRFVRCQHRALTEKLVTCQTARSWPGSNSPSPLPSEIFWRIIGGLPGKKWRHMVKPWRAVQLSIGRFGAQDPCMYIYLPAPSKGCQMVPKGCQFTIP